MDEFTKFKDYSGLIKKNEYDKPKAELLAEAITERITLEKRITYLNDLIEENADLIAFLWTTLDGECKPLHKLTDSHLKNIMTHLLNRGHRITPTIKAEAMSRNIDVPTETPRILIESGEVIDDEGYED